MHPIVDIGVFAHQEEAGIAAMVTRLLAQDLAGFDARIVVLANGCRDATAERARDAGAEAVVLSEGGKSRTWNRFVHTIARREAEVLVFCDADITLPTPDTLARLVRGLLARPPLWALNSQPVKDIVVHPEGLGPLDRLIAAAGGGLDDWRTAICGQLYAMPAARARRVHMPIGLPVEDGFLRAMILTDGLEGPEDFRRIDGLVGLFHIYASERGIKALIRHQERIVIGSAINAAVFGHLRQLTVTARRAEMVRAAGREDWLAEVVQARLPAFPYGYVPFHFLFKRLARLVAAPGQLLRPKLVLVALLGFGFDGIVFIRAQIRMARGTGAGFW